MFFSLFFFCSAMCNQPEVTQAIRARKEEVWDGYPCGCVAGCPMDAWGANSGPYGKTCSLIFKFFFVHAQPGCTAIAAILNSDEGLLNQGPGSWFPTGRAAPPELREDHNPPLPAMAIPRPPPPWPQEYNPPPGPREYHDDPPPPSPPNLCPHPATSARGNTTSPAPWLSRAPSSLLRYSCECECEL